MGHPKSIETVATEPASLTLELADRRHARKASHQTVPLLDAVARPSRDSAFISVAHFLILEMLTPDHKIGSSPTAQADRNRRPASGIFHSHVKGARKSSRCATPSAYVATPVKTYRRLEG